MVLTHFFYHRAAAANMYLDASAVAFVAVNSTDNIAACKVAGLQILSASHTLVTHPLQPSQSSVTSLCCLHALLCFYRNALKYVKAVDATPGACQILGSPMP